MAEVDFRVKNGLVVGTNATITGTITASTFVGDGSGITGVTTTATASYDSLTGTVPTWNQNTTGTAAGLSTTLAVASGGTGLTTVGTTGNVLTSNGTAWVSSPAPISLPTQTGNTGKYLTTDGATASWTTVPIDSKANIDSPTFTGTVSGITKSMVGLGNVDNTTDLLKPISTATQTALDLKSPLASPTFTGTPSVPTATVGTNTTQIASTAYVRAEVSALVASAPTALDTLNELATALGNDANFSTTVTTALGLKAPLASPTFTGTVSGITASMVGLANVTNTSDANKPVSTATQTALDLKAPLSSPTFTGVVTAPNSLLKVTTSSYPTIRPSLNLDFANSQSVDPRITFTRASTATRVRQDGLIEVVASGSPRINFDPVTQVCKGLLIEEQRTNLLTYSENFDNAAWLKINSTITANAITAPDGTVTADKLVENTSNAAHYIYEVFNPSSGIDYTYSFYAKSGEKTSVFAQVIFGGVNSLFTVNLSDGTKSIITTNTGTLFDAVSVGNGWYRCSIKVTTTSTSIGNVVIATANGTVVTYTGDGTSGLYIWGAQLEVGSFATSYIPSSDTFTSRASTATYVGSNGLIQSALTNVARYNYNPVNLALAPKLLLESASTNLLTYSEQFDNAVWTKDNVTVTAEFITAPDGTMTAEKIQTSLAATGNTGHVGQLLSITANNVVNTLSMYVKKGNIPTVSLNLYNTTPFNQALITYNFDTELFTNTAGALYPIATSVGNGWVRLSLSLAGTASTGVVCRVYVKDQGTTNTTLDYVYIWGAQLEAGSFPTSYIPTVASQVTRAADISSSAQTTRVADTAVMTGTNFSSWYNQTEGTVFTKQDFLYSLSNSIITNIDDGTGTYGKRLQQSKPLNVTTYTVLDNVNNARVVDVSIGGSGIDNSCYTYKTNDYAICGNGTVPQTDSSGSVPTPLSRLVIGANPINIAILNGHISKLSYYPKRLTNSELQALTTG